WVGHPVVESGLDHGDGAAFRGRHQVPETAPLLSVLPGSREGEVLRLLPIFEETVRRLTGRFPGLQVVIPTVANVAAKVEDAVSGWPARAVVLRDPREKPDAFAASDAALAASGTVALELGVAKVPAVIGYRMHPVTAWLAHRLVKVKYVNLINLLL